MNHELSLPASPKEILVVLDAQQCTQEELQRACTALTRSGCRRVIFLDGAGSFLNACAREGLRTLPAAGLDNRYLASENDLLYIEIEESSLSPRPAHYERALDWFVLYQKIFLFCDPAAPWLRKLLHQSFLLTGTLAPAGWLLGSPSVSEGDRRFLQVHAVRIVEEEPSEWWAKWEQARPVPAPRAGSAGQATGDSPYPFLDTFGPGDATRFFGRFQDTRTLGELALSGQFTILYGPSGAGKTSLIGAGLLPALEKSGARGLHVRLTNERLWGLGTAGTIAESQDRMADLLVKESARSACPLVVVFDQCEDLFTRFGEFAVEQFARDLSEALERTGGKVHFVLAIREDYLARVNVLRGRLPRIFDRPRRLSPLTAAQAYEAIVHPAESSGYEFEPGLAYAILHDLSGADGLIMPADLQIVCYALFQDLLSQGGKRFTMDAYERQGGARKILQDYLERVLLQPDCPPQARQVLKGLVTSQGMRSQVTAQDLAQSCALSLPLVQECLEWLERPHRLVRPLPREQGGVRYELAHDVVARRVLEWIKDPLEKRAREVKDLAALEVSNFNAYHLLPGLARLQRITLEWDNPFLHLTQEELCVIVRGSLRCGYQPERWITRLDDSAARPLLSEALLDPLRETRRGAFQVLGADQALAILQPLLNLPEEEVRLVALRTIAWCPQERSWPALRAARRDRAERVRAAAWELLFGIDRSGAERLREADQRDFFLAGSGLSGALLLLIFSHGLAGLVPWIAFLAWLIFSAFGLLAGKLPRALQWGGLALVSGIALAARLGWSGAAPALLLMAVLQGNLSIGLIAAGAFWTLTGTSLNLQSFLTSCAVGIGVHAGLAVTLFRRQFLRQERVLSWSLLGLGAGAVLLDMLIGHSMQPVVLLGVCGAVVGTWAGRPSLFGRGTKSSLGGVLTFLQKNWDMIEQISPHLRPASGWLLGSLLGGLLLNAAAVILGNTNAPVGLWQTIGFGFAVAAASWPMRLRIANLLKALILGGVGGALLGGIPAAVLVGAFLILYTFLFRKNQL